MGVKKIRVRKKPWADAYIKQNPRYVEEEPEKLKGKWNKVFVNSAPIYLELGMGKGSFLLKSAQQHPENNYVGMEINRSVLALALKKIKEANVSNIKLINANGNNLENFFSKGELKGLYLNFSDPWPKKRHAKRRLTSPIFLNVYKNILPSHAFVEFKTDNRQLFEYSVVNFSNYNFILDSVNVDLYHSDEINDNIETEYESKFRMTSPIYKIKVHTK